MNVSIKFHDNPSNSLLRYFFLDQHVRPTEWLCHSQARNTARKAVKSGPSSVNVSECEGPAITGNIGILKQRK